MYLQLRLATLYLVFGISTTYGATVNFTNNAAISTAKGKFTPPGTVHVSANLFADETEISNISWLEYLYWTKKAYGHTSTAYQHALPDTTVWESKVPAFTAHYLRHPDYRQYPVVGISYQQAIEFCTWRSARVNELIYLKQNKDADLKTAEIPTYVTYRLPTRDEWNTFSAPSADKKQKTPQANREKQAPYPVRSLKKNTAELYHTNSNVSELLAEGIIAEGSLAPTNLSANFTRNYEKPTSTLGFRCVCVVVQYP